MPSPTSFLLIWGTSLILRTTFGRARVWQPTVVKRERKMRSRRKKIKLNEYDHSQGPSAVVPPRLRRRITAHFPLLRRSDSLLARRPRRSPTLDCDAARPPTPVGDAARPPTTTPPAQRPVSGPPPAPTAHLVCDAAIAHPPTPSAQRPASSRRPCRPPPYLVCDAATAHPPTPSPQRPASSRRPRRPTTHTRLRRRITTHHRLRSAAASSAILLVCDAASHLHSPHPRQFLIFFISWPKCCFFFFSLWRSAQRRAFKKKPNCGSLPSLNMNGFFPPF